jgi:hypothetical protein
MKEKIDLNKIDTIDLNNVIDYYRKLIDDADYKILLLNEQLSNYKRVVDAMAEDHPGEFIRKEEEDGKVTKINTGFSQK